MILPSHCSPPHAVGSVAGSSALIVITAPGPGTGFGLAAAAKPGPGMIFFGKVNEPTVGSVGLFGTLGPTLIVPPGATKLVVESGVAAMTWISTESNPVDSPVLSSANTLPKIVEPAGTPVVSTTTPSDFS